MSRRSSGARTASSPHVGPDGGNEATASSSRSMARTRAGHGGGPSPWTGGRTSSCGHRRDRNPGSTPALPVSVLSGSATGWPTASRDAPLMRPFLAATLLPGAVPTGADAIGLNEFSSSQWRRRAARWWIRQ